MRKEDAEIKETIKLILKTDKETAQRLYEYYKNNPDRVGNLKNIAEDFDTLSLEENLHSCSNDE